MASRVSSRCFRLRETFEKCSILGKVIRDSKGSGFGLAIAKTIIEGHGGRIWAENGPAKGSVFSFTLPKQ
jgi:signal transduction histidine kinase